MSKKRSFKRFFAGTMVAAVITSAIIPTPYVTKVEAASARQVESLSRGLSVTALSSGTLVNWRYLGTDTPDTTFKLYRDTKLIYTSTSGDATCYKDTEGSVNSTYTLRVYNNSNASNYTTYSTEYKLNYDSAAKAGYFDIQLDTPKDSRLGATYTANDASVADLNGDGDYELIIKWDPNNSQDNSKSGATSNVIIDAYEMEPGNATRLWRIDLGQNIRAGAHYTQFMVYDFDGDGKAEMVCKTAPGSKDGQGNYVNKASKDSDIKNASDNGKSYANSSGYVLSGSEYLTLFDGESGKALDTIYYEPARGTVSSWGDNYGNRVDRFLACVAYLDGKTPSVVMCRGYYTRSVLAAYTVENNRLVSQWLFDSNNAGSSYAGQGNHNLAAADVDNDGKDEIVYGSMTVDHDGTGLYSSKLGHGDALHVGDFIPGNGALEIYQVHETSPYGASLRNAKTGKIIKHWTASKDTGRGIADNIIPGNSEAEFVCTGDSVIYNSSGSKVADWSSVTKWNMNSLIYWDGDLEREVLDRTMIDDYPNGRIFTGQGIEFNNSTKANMCITADLFGDWREEIVARLSDGSGVRVYATSYDTDYRLYTLMHNTQYRTGVAAENVAYNQPPHVDFFIGTGYALPSLPSVYAVGNGSSSNVIGSGSESATPAPTQAPTSAPTQAPTSAPTTSSKSWNFKENGFTSLGTINSTKTIDGLTLIATSSKTMSVVNNVQKVDGIEYTYALSLGGGGNTSYRAVKVPVTGNDVIKVVLKSTGSSERTLIVADKSGNKLGTMKAGTSASLGTYNYSGDTGYVYLYSSNSGINLYNIQVDSNGAVTEAPTVAPTAAPTAAPTVAPTVAPTAAPTETPSEETESIVHNFTTDAKSSSFFTISGNLSSSKGTVTYNGLTLTQCLKIESKTNISFTTDSDATLVLVFNSANSKDIKVDGKKYTLSDGILELKLSAGTHTLTKSNSGNLFYMELTK